MTTDARRQETLNLIERTIGDGRPRYMREVKYKALKEHRAALRKSLRHRVGTTANALAQIVIDQRWYHPSKLKDFLFDDEFSIRGGKIVPADRH